MIFIDQKQYLSRKEAGTALSMAPELIGNAMCMSRKGRTTPHAELVAQLAETSQIVGGKIYFPRALVLKLAEEKREKEARQLALQYELIDILSEANSNGKKWSALAKLIGVSTKTLFGIRSLMASPRAEKLSAYIAAMRGKQ